MEILKYLPPDRKDFFSTFRLRFTQPLDMNDPYECLPAILNPDYDLLFENVIDQMDINLLRMIHPDIDQAKLSLKDDYMRTGKIEQLDIDVYKRELNKRIGILCLSRKHDSILMWSHYTENHKGFVLGFDSNHDFFKKQGTDEGDIGEL